ncbi:MAG: ABC transporter ATP-binding protein [Candidatus Caldatribacteriaceae bacterium]
MDSPPLVELNKVSKIYGQVIRYQVLFDITLTVPPGQFLALIGPSGSGKSTLLNLIGALDRPTNGTILIQGKNISNLSDEELAFFRNQFMGFIFQFHYLLPEFNALENVLIPYWIRSQKPSKEMVNRAMYLLEEVGLKDAAFKKITLLSGGQQQRVAIARALLNYPKLVLADEPTGALDTKTGEQVLELLNRIREQSNMTMIMVTHNRDVALQADRVIELIDGKLCKEVYPKMVGLKEASQILESHACNLEEASDSLSNSQTT